MKRRALLGFGAALATPGLARALTLRDALGREVVLRAPPRAILLTEGFQLLSLALLHPDPVSLLAGWGGDLGRFDPPLQAAYRRRFPRLASVPVVGAGTVATLSLESALSLRPDLVVVSAWQAADDTMRILIAALERAGIPVAVVDFFLRPLANTPSSLRLLGALLDRREQGEALASLVETRVAALRARLAGAPPGPRVMLHAFPGRWPCCWTSGAGGMGEYLDLLGARGIGASLLGARLGGQLSLEAVITQDPEVYVATGRSEALEPGSLSMGLGVTPAAARASLASLATAPEFASLAAMRGGRVHGLWNSFNALPVGVVGLEALARWIRPAQCGDIDPGATLAEINARFAAMPYDDTYWTSLGQG